MHTLVDLRGNLPVSVYLTSASVNDVKKKRHLAMFLIYESIVFIKKNIYNSKRLTS